MSIMALEGFNPDRFDDGDLWRQSKALITEIPGLHVASVFKPIEHTDDQWVTTGLLRITNDAPVKVTLGETAFRGPENAAFRLFWQTQDSMRNPLVDGHGAREQDFGATTDTVKQVRAAKAFLPFLKRLSLEVPRTVTEADPTPIKELEYHFYGNACPTAEHVQGLAEVNVYLAALAGHDIAPYEDIRERAATWKPQKHMTTLSWL